MNKTPRTEKARNDAWLQWKKESKAKPSSTPSVNYYTGYAYERLCEQLETELNEAKTIIQAALKELPVGHIPSHTPESSTERVKYYVGECARMEWELNHFNAEDAAYRDHLRSVASDAKQDTAILDWLLDNAKVQTGEDGNNYFVLPIIPATFCTAPLGKREAIIKEIKKQQTK